MVFDLGADQRDSMTEHDQGPLMWISNNGEKNALMEKKIKIMPLIVLANHGKSQGIFGPVVLVNE